MLEQRPCPTATAGSAATTILLGRAVPCAGPTNEAANTGCENSAKESGRESVRRGGSATRRSAHGHPQLRARGTSVRQDSCRTTFHAESWLGSASPANARSRRPQAGRSRPHCQGAFSHRDRRREAPGSHHAEACGRDRSPALASPELIAEHWSVQKAFVKEVRQALSQLEASLAEATSNRDRLSAEHNLTKANDTLDRAHRVVARAADQIQNRKPPTLG